MQMGRSLVSVAFAYLLTSDEKYAGFKERFLTIASYPPGGYASPEGASVPGCVAADVLVASSEEPIARAALVPLCTLGRSRQQPDRDRRLGPAAWPHP